MSPNAAQPELTVQLQISSKLLQGIGGGWVMPENAVVLTPAREELRRYTKEQIIGLVIELGDTLNTIRDYCQETMSDEEWNQNVGRGEWDPVRVEMMRVPCKQILGFIEEMS